MKTHKIIEPDGWIYNGNIFDNDSFVLKKIKKYGAKPFYYSLSNSSESEELKYYKAEFEAPVISEPSDEDIRSYLIKNTNTNRFSDEWVYFTKGAKWMRDNFSFKDKSKDGGEKTPQYFPVPTIEERESKWISVKSILEDCFKDGNEQCDGGCCMGCWKDKVREAIKLL